MMFHVVGLIAVVCVGAQAASLVPPCASTDRECLKRSAQSAVPLVAGGLAQYGAGPLDPLFIKKIEDTQAGLRMNFRDSTVTGLKGCQIEYLKREKAENKIKLALHCDAAIKGLYTLGGRLLILPVEGNGTYTITAKDLRIKLTMDTVDQTGEDGKKHWHVTDFHHSYKGVGGARFDFKNLFNGNKELSDAIHSFANSNSEEIIREVGAPIVKAIVARIVATAETIFSKVPAEELATDA